MHDAPSPYRDSLPSEAAYPPAPRHYQCKARDVHSGHASEERIRELSKRAARELPLFPPPPARPKTGHEPTSAANRHDADG